MPNKPISTNSEWTFDLLRDYDSAIASVADKYRLDTYPNQIEVINSEQMLDAYASSGMPINYHHWSFGKHFISMENRYKRGHMGLAYEIVINSNPCIAYLMEENSMCMQALVIAHASYGHNSFFKNNYLFKTWTDAGSIIDYLLFARNFIAECEERHGIDEVEALLDACHALMNYGVDRYKRPYPISIKEEQARQREREQHLQQQVNELWKTIPQKEQQEKQQAYPKFPSEPQENLLYFIEKSAPLLEPWQREVVRIVRKVAQYLYPQRQTKVMNEGWACFWHFTILHELYKDGLVDDGFMMEFLQHHTNVIYQPPYDSPYYSGINPYTLGFAMMQDIRRICENPTDEDRQWFPDIAGSDWLTTLHFAMENFKDDSFILQFLSPKVIRDLKLFTIVDNSELEHLEVGAIHDESGYKQVRQDLAASYNLGNIEPNIQISDVDIRGDRSLTLQHTQYSDRPLGDTTKQVMHYLHRLWKFDIRLDSISNDAVTESYQFPEKEPLPEKDP